MKICEKLRSMKDNKNSRFFFKISICIICVLLIGLGASFYLCESNARIDTIRGENERVISINDNTIISQNITMKSGKYVWLSLLVDISKRQNKNECLSLILQNEENETAIDIPMDSFIEDGWQTVQINLKKESAIRNAESIVIKGNNLCDGEIGVLLTNGVQLYPENTASINGENTNSYLCIGYENRDYSNLMVYFIKFVLIISCFIFLVILMNKLLKTYPITSISILVISIFFIKNNLYSVTTIDGWIQSTWLLDYRYGLVNRGFVGTLLSFVLTLFRKSDYISMYMLSRVIFITTIITSVVVIFFIFLIEKRTIEKSFRNSVQILLLSWILSPWFITFFLTGATYGRIDIICIAVFLLSVYLILDNKFIWSVPFLSIIGILTYHVYIILSIPVIFVMLLEAWRIRKKQIYIVYNVVNSILSIVMALFIHFYGHLSGKITMDEFYTAQTLRTDSILDYSVTVCYPFNTALGADDSRIYHLRIRLLLLIFACLPILFYLIKIRIYAIKLAITKIDKLIQAGYIIAPCASILLWNSSDLLRYFVWVYTALIMGLIFSIVENKSVTPISINVESEYSEKLGKNYLAILLSLLAFVGISEGTCWPFSSLTDAVFEQLKTFLI